MARIKSLKEKEMSRPSHSTLIVWLNWISKNNVNFCQGFTDVFSHLTLKLGCSKAKEGHSKERIYKHQQLAGSKTSNINNQEDSMLGNRWSPTWEEAPWQWARERRGGREGRLGTGRCNAGKMIANRDPVGDHHEDHKDCLTGVFKRTSMGSSLRQFSLMYLVSWVQGLGGNHEVGHAGHRGVVCPVLLVRQHLHL